jgi:predicted Zn-dependent peptidase
MRDFHRTWYRPEWMTVAVVGNLPVDDLMAIVSDSLDSLGSKGNSRPISHPITNLQPEAPFNEIIRQEYEDENLQQARLILFWKVPGLRDLEKTYPLDVLAAILGQGKVSRLFQSLRQEKGLVSQITASNMSQTVQGVFSVSAQLASENIEQVESEIISQIGKIQKEAVTVSELERVKTQVANRFIFSSERPSDRANLYGYYHTQIGDLQPAFCYPQDIEALTLEDIQNACQEYLNPNAYGVVVVRPIQ